MKDGTLKVYYPFGGRTFLLHWWTYDERGHLVLAATERALTALAKSVFDKHPEAEIKGYCEIDVVGPPERLHVLAFEQGVRERVARFHREIVTCMSAVVESDKPLPSIFAVCPSYEPDENHIDADEWAREGHYGCKRCLDKIQLVGLTPGDLYARYYDAWLAAHPDHRDHDRGRRRDSKEPQRVFSLAEPACDDDQLWCARADFGHHAAGIALKEVNIEEPDTISDGVFSHSCLDDHTLFFFKRLRDLDASALQTMLDAAKAASEKSREDYEQERIARRDRERAEEVDDSLAFFNKAP